MVSFVSVVTSRPVVPEASYNITDGINFPVYVDIMLSYLAEFELGEVARSATTAYNGFFSWQQFTEGKPCARASSGGSRSTDPQDFSPVLLREFL